jgi:hypothetical protein
MCEQYSRGIFIQGGGLVGLGIGHADLELSIAVDRLQMYCTISMERMQEIVR